MRNQLQSIAGPKDLHGLNDDPSHAFASDDPDLDPVLLVLARRHDGYDTAVGKIDVFDRFVGLLNHEANGEIDMLKVRLDVGEIIRPESAENRIAMYV